jgi:hypothetical protein
MACGSFNFFSLVFEEKSPIELGAMFWSLLFKRVGNMAFWVWCSLIHNWITRWASCSLIYIKDMDFTKTGRFFENPLVGRHVLLIKINDMAFWVNFECPSFFLTLPFGGVKKLTCLWVAVLATTTLGRHVLWFENQVHGFRD